MKMKKRLGSFFSVLAILFLSACSTDYRADAVEQAREYVLDHTEGLTVLQRNHIRYNDPVILNKVVWTSVVPRFTPSGHLVTRYDRNMYVDPTRDMMMQCMAWDVPGMDGQLTVVGYGQRDYRYWSPNRIVIRKEQDFDIAGEKIRKKAMLFALESLPELSGRLLSRVRFAVPEVNKSLFLLDDPVKPESRKGDWMTFLKKAAENEPFQISAVWREPDSNRCVIVAGFATDKNLNTWLPEKIFETTEEEAKASLGSKYTVMSSEDDSEEDQDGGYTIAPAVPEGEF